MTLITAESLEAAVTLPEVVSAIETEDVSERDKDTAAFRVSDTAMLDESLALIALTKVEFSEMATEPVSLALNVTNCCVVSDTDRLAVSADDFSSRIVKEDVSVIEISLVSSSSVTIDSSRLGSAIRIEEPSSPWTIKKLFVVSETETENVSDADLLTFNDEVSEIAIEPESDADLAALIRRLEESATAMLLVSLATMVFVRSTVSLMLIELVSDAVGELRIVAVSEIATEPVSDLVELTAVEDVSAILTLDVSEPLVEVELDNTLVSAIDTALESDANTATTIAAVSEIETADVSVLV